MTFRRSAFADAGVMTLGALTLYWITLAPGLIHGDGPSLATSAWRGKVGAAAFSHSLYIAAGYVWSHAIRVGAVAWRLNLMSAWWGALSVGGAVALGHIVCSGLGMPRVYARAGSGMAAVLLAANHTFWWNAVSIEVYTLSTLFVVILLLLGVAAARTGSPLYGAYLIGGLALSAVQHLQITILALWWVPWLLWRMRREHKLRLRTFALFCVAGCLGSIPFAFLLWRDATVQYGNWMVAMYYAIGGPFLQLVRSAGLSPLWVAKNVAATVLWDATPWGVFAGFMGAVVLWRAERRLFWWLVPAIALSGWQASTYVVPDQPEFFMVFYALCVPLVAVGCATGLRLIRERWGRRAAVGSGLLAAIVPFAINLSLPAPASREDWDRLQRRRPGIAHMIMSPNMRGQTWLEDWARNALQNAAPHALIVAYHMTDYWGFTTLTHRQLVYGTRPDIDVRCFAGNTATPIEFRELYERTLPRRPLYLTGWNASVYGTVRWYEDFTFESEAGLVRVSRRPGSHAWLKGDALPCVGVWTGRSSPDGREVRLKIDSWSQGLRGWLRVSPRIPVGLDEHAEFFFEQPFHQLVWDPVRQQLVGRLEDFQGFPLTVTGSVQGDVLSATWNLGVPSLLSGTLRLQKGED